MVRLAPFQDKMDFAAIVHGADGDGDGARIGSNPVQHGHIDGNGHGILSSGRPSDPTPLQPQSQSQPQPLPQELLQYQPPPKTTRVDGIGIWRSWKRNFSTPLLALLDLIDNSLDAAIASQLELLLGEEAATSGGPGGFVGRVHIHPDAYEAHAHAHHHLRQHPASASVVTGVCIVNNSHRKIRPLAKVLEVYNSSKIHSGAGDIGENGVGLKQGCATLSKLSFVLVKSGGNDNVELGIVAESLQRLEGCYLPAFQFDNSHGPDNPSLRRQMHALFSQPHHRDVAACIAQYGAPSTASPPDLSVGIDRLCRKFDDICYRFHGCDHVFALVLDKVVHGMNNEKTGAAPSNEHEHRVRVQEYMRALREELPKNYLHVPDNFEFIVDGKKVAFRHWPARLAELAVFPLTVSKTQPLLKMRGNFDGLEEGRVDNSYRLRVFLGFDKERVVVKDAKKEASVRLKIKHEGIGRGAPYLLYVYSRQSGRLVKVVADSRTDLSLSAGGTMFCQGLTIIIDDIGGHLPLNPTKQDVAFGEENCGGIHKENLYQSVGAVTNFYYNYHLDKYGGRKQELTRKIADLADARVERPFKSIDSADVTTFRNVKFKKAHRNIRIVTKPMPDEVVGDDTVFRLERPVAPSTTTGRKRPLETVSSSAVPMPPRPFAQVAHPPSAPLPAPVTSSHIQMQSIPRRSLPAPPTNHASATIPAAERRSSHSPSQLRAARKPVGILRNGIGPAKATSDDRFRDHARIQEHGDAPRRNSKYFEQQRGVAQPSVTQDEEEDEGEERDPVVRKDNVRESEESEMEGDAVTFETETETETEPNAERDDAPSPIVSSTPASPPNRNGSSAIDVDSEDGFGDAQGEYVEGQIVINERTPPNIIISEMEKYQGLCEQLTLKVESEKEARKREKKELKKEFKRENAELKLENERLMAKVAELERMVAAMNRQD
ncbi:hypothetical protein ACHAXS_009042 [Conticribra weissflogii]